MPLRRIVGEILRQVNIEVDLAFVPQLEDRGRRELLGDRSDLEHRIGGHGDVPLHICLSVCLEHEGVAALDHRNGKPGDPPFDEQRLRDRVHHGDLLGPRHLGSYR
jgi:hypothetical protein